jgi:TonB dependent receptor/TonB-dependent Receptor Plug Domain
MQDRVLAVLVVAILVGAPSAAFGQADGKKYEGRAVADVLKELQATRLKIIFSSELVPPALRVVKEPRGDGAKDIALQILEPHGLTLQQGPGGTFLVVAAPRRKPDARPPAPVNADPVTTPPAAEVEPLRVAETVDVNERAAGGVGSRGYAVDPAAVVEMAGGLDNVIQSLQMVPGVAATTDEDGKLAVRGAGPQHNLVVLDGIQIHNVQRLGEFTTSFLNPATAANITLDPSGLEARFGGRLSSVVNLETRDGTTERRLAASGSVGLTAGDILLEGRMPGTTTGSWWATARGTYYRLVRDRFEDNVMPSFSDVQFKISLSPTSRTRLTLFGLAGRETLLDRRSEIDEAVVVQARTDATNIIGAATLRWTPTSRFLSTTTLSAYDHSGGHVDNMAPGLSRTFPYFDRHIGIRDYALRHQMYYATAKGQMIDAGVDLHVVRSRWNMSGTKQPGWWRGIGPDTWGELIDYASGPIDSRLRRTQAGAWFQLRLDAGRVMTIEPGIRADWNSFTGETAWQPRLRVSRLFGRTSVWAGFSTQAQTPSHESLQGFEYFDFSESSTADLRNERTSQIVAGAERALAGGISVRVEAYHRAFDRLLVQRRESDAAVQERLRDYIITADVPPETAILENRPTIYPENTGSGRATGVEFLVRRDGRRVNGSVAYTLSSSTRDLFDRTIPSDFDRRHAFNAIVNVPLSARWRAAATWQLASGFPTTPILKEVWFSPVKNPDGTFGPQYAPLREPDGSLTKVSYVFHRRLSAVNSARLTGYSRVDVRGTYSTEGHWEFYGEVINLFNHRNYLQRTDDSLPGEPRRETRSNIYETFERMVSFGVRVKF